MYTSRFSIYPDVKQESSFLGYLVGLARKENIEGWIIYPNDDETVCLLAKHKKELEQYYRLITPSWDVVKFAYDKRLTYELATKCGIAIPKTFYPRTMEELEQLDIEFPAIIKASVKEPFYSRTRKKAIAVNDKKQLMDEYSRAVKLIAAHKH